MSNTYNFSNNTKTSGGWIYLILLFVSFLWVALYPATNMIVSSFEFGYGNLLNFSGENSSFVVMMILSEALYMFISFEIVFYLYRYFLTFKIYTFIVPTENLKVESRVFFIYRNLVFGLVSNLCFLFPFLFKFLPFFDLVITLIFLLVYGVDGCLTICHRIILHENLGEAHRKHVYQLMANELKIGHVKVSLLYMAMQLIVSLGFIYLCPNTVAAHWIYMIGAIVVLGVAYVLFKKKYYHLHEAYLASIKN